jgi:hypothetical protein
MAWSAGLTSANRHRLQQPTAVQRRSHRDHIAAGLATAEPEPAGLAGHRVLQRPTSRHRGDNPRRRRHQPLTGYDETCPVRARAGWLARRRAPSRSPRSSPRSRTAPAAPAPAPLSQPHPARPGRRRMTHPERRFSCVTWRGGLPHGPGQRCRSSADSWCDRTHAAHLMGGSACSAAPKLFD